MIQPTTLTGNVVRVEPASPQHAGDLAEIYEPRLFQHYLTLLPDGGSEQNLRDFIQASWDFPNTIPHAIIHLESGKAIGMSCYMDIREPHRALEIGMTWIAPAHWGTKVNPECKLLLLTHAFEVLGMHRVQLKTDGRNVHSQTAIRKLGAQFEGVLRKHGICWDGYVRDTHMFSILDTEWPAVKAGLQARL